jgi:uncharacterized protein
MTFIFTLIITFLLIDIYVFQALRTVLKGKNKYTKQIIYTAFWLVTFVSIFTPLSGAFTNFHEWSTFFKSYLTGFIFVVYVGKLPLIIFLLIDDIARLVRLIIRLVKSISSKKESQKTEGLPAINRKKFLSQFGMIAGFLPFSSMVYGMIHGAYDYQIKKMTIKLPRLPSSFNGLKIVQISDLHLGSFIFKDPISKVVSMVNAQKPDIIFITGDLVNHLSTEINGFEDELSKLKANHGVYSILGNHDYGEYVQWENEEKQAENFNAIVQAQKNIGWKLLRNENVILRAGTEKIALIGVENWSAFGNFMRYGDMQKALSGAEDTQCKLLLTHDPSHWESEILLKYPEIDMTFSGHTHGMQFGIDTPGFKWSPVQYFYKYWHGLYKKNNQYLYVNRGIGFTGYPGRVGMTPEITLFRMEKA